MFKVRNFISKNRINISRWLIFLGTGIVLWFLIRGYFFDDFINPETAISLDRSSKVGDFIGGVIGAIFTLVGIVLLYETLALQRTELRESRKVFEKQQFENIFFGLLKLYNDIVNSLHFTSKTSKHYTGRDFFSAHQKECFSSYKLQGSVYKNRKNAIDTYQEFYINNKEQLAHYYRTLYRIFKIVDSSSFTELEKINYAKIIRSQLSEGEQFFLNYNATTSFGINFRPLVLKYSLIKHLPILEKLEFKAWRTKLDQTEVYAINILFLEIRGFLKAPIPKKDFFKTYLKGMFGIKVIHTEHTVTIKIYRKEKVTPSTFQQSGYGLNKFDNRQLADLFRCFLLEINNALEDNYNENLDVKRWSNQQGDDKSEITIVAESDRIEIF